MDEVRIARLTSPRFAEALRETDTVIIPAGSTEVLGRHGPLGADGLVAEAAAVMVGRLAGCLVAPPVLYGDALELAAWPGTVTLSQETLTALYLDICRSLVRHGVRRLFFLNAHMMNSYAIHACGRHLRQAGVAVAQGSWWSTAFSVAADLVETQQYPNAHGGEVITSVVMAIAPESVHLEDAVPEEPKEGLAWHGRHLPGGGSPFTTYGDFSDYCESGSWGDPGAASAEKGRIILERGAARMAEFIAEFRSHPLPERPTTVQAEEDLNR